jgi:DNA-binding IscR family transcriptional regulator
MTSDDLAECLHTNPVVVRRTMAALREAGFVRSERGHGGGWMLVRDLGTITLLDVYVALDEPAMFSLGERSGAPGCVVAEAVHGALAGALGEAQTLMRKRFDAVTLAHLAADFHYRHVASKRKRKARSK